MAYSDSLTTLFLTLLLGVCIGVLFTRLFGGGKPKSKAEELPNERQGFSRPPAVLIPPVRDGENISAPKNLVLPRPVRVPARVAPSVKTTTTVVRSKPTTRKPLARRDPKRVN